MTFNSNEFNKSTEINENSASNRTLKVDQNLNEFNTVAFMTLGCKTNQYETDALMDLFHRNGNLIVDFDEIADIYIINTCTVTQVSDKKSRQMIRRAKKQNPNAITIVMGCYAQISPDEVASLEGVDIVLGTNERYKILDYISDVQNKRVQIPLVIVEDIGKVNIFEDMQLNDLHVHTRAFIKIQEGCNQFCSYCIIPYARGRVRSRHLDQVVKEITKLVSAGYVEFVLTGIHIGSYGKDFEDISLIDLIEAIHQITGVKRIRLGSLEPTLIDELFVERLAKLPKVCDHFHLSLQSGSNTVLKRMNRKYLKEDFKSAVNRLRNIYENPAITTDIIVGFPGETALEFEETKAFVSEIGFSELHVFPFSPRKGTPAATMPDQVDNALKKFRSENLISIGSMEHLSYQEIFIGKSLEIILEEFKNGFWIGHATNYLKVAVNSDNSSFKSGKSINVEGLALKDGQLFGRLVQNHEND